MIPSVLILFIILVPLMVAYKFLSILVNTIVMVRVEFIEYFDELKCDVSRMVKHIIKCWDIS